VAGREGRRRDGFLLQPATVAAWTKRVDEGGDGALLETPEPVNRLPDFVRYIVKRLKLLCPTMGKKRIAQTLARAGLALGVSTVGRILKEHDTERPEPDENVAAEGLVDSEAGKPVEARKPHDVWQVDLTVVPTAAGFWTAWFPFTAEQIWPYAWWVACVVDHYSRCVMGFAVFWKEPKSIDIRRFLGGVAAKAGASPRYIVSDKGRQFDCVDFRAWCERRKISPRYASTGSLRATAVVERFVRSLKDEWLRRIQVPFRRDAMQRELAWYKRWFEEHRPHQALEGRTPREVYAGFEAETPPVDVARPLELVVHFHGGRRVLPIVELKNAA
jgi:putative transposase